ncbi:unnamed protein product [Symbiodinium microadriaticum]|nr:unnamed protein product [Symbiodinium microadriaticum]
MEAQVIDEFWSHSWQAPSWQKYVNLLFLNNTWPASVVGTLTAVAALVLFLTGVLPEWAETGRTCRWCILLGTLAYYPTFLLFRPRKSVFFDAACINQRDMDLKFEGLVSMGAILKRSKSMLVLWDPSYVTRLWCVFEMAAFLNAHGSAAVKVCPPLLGTVLMICHFVLCVITFISHWLLQQDSWSWAYLATLPALWLPTFTFMAYAVRSEVESRVLVLGLGVWGFRI